MEKLVKLAEEKADINYNVFENILKTEEIFTQGDVYKMKNICKNIFKIMKKFNIDNLKYNKNIPKKSIRFGINFFDDDTIYKIIEKNIEYIYYLDETKFIIIKDIIKKNSDKLQIECYSNDDEITYRFVLKISANYSEISVDKICDVDYMKNKIILCKGGYVIHNIKNENLIY